MLNEAFVLAWAIPGVAIFLVTLMMTRWGRGESFTYGDLVVLPLAAIAGPIITGFVFIIALAVLLRDVPIRAPRFLRRKR